MNRILLFFLLISSVGFGQNFTSSVTGHYGTSSADNLSQTIKCQDGGFLMISSSNGTDLDKTGPNYGGYDIWVLRLNADKTIRWEKTYGGDQNEYPKSVVELENGTILLLGNSSSGVSGNKTSLSYGNTDLWLLKLSSDGNKIWEQSFGSSGIEASSTILEISDTRYHIVASSNGGISGTKTVPSYGLTDVWTIAIDSSGTELWQRSYGGNDFDGVSEQNTIRLQNGNLLILVASQTGISGDKTTVSYGDGDAWVIEVNPANGQIIQQNSIGGLGYDVMYKVVQHEGYIYLAGISNSGFSGNKESPLFGNRVAWLLKLDSSLLVVSDQSFGGTNRCAFSGIISTSNGLIAYGEAWNDNNPWVSGSIKGTKDSWMVGFDDAGNYQWNYLFGTFTDGIINVLVDVFENSSSSFTFSFCSSSPGDDGDLNVLAYGFTDLYLVDLDSDLGLSDFSADPFSVYPNPVINAFSIKGLTESASYEIADMQGKIVESGNYNGFIDAQKFTTGMYTIRIVSGNQTIIKKWIKD